MNLRTLFAAALLSASAFAPTANAQYANHGGVMLQGFYWDSYTDTKWTNLTSQAEELSQYFNLIWIPNSARDSAAGGNSMGYTPVYWFSRYTTCFGTEAELRTMIQTYKALGTGFIADVVVNHRSGVSNWTNFPTEKWRNVTYQLGPEHICCNDEVANQSGQAKPTGAYDTGENYEAARDLDHTSTTVQDNIKAYEQCLIEDFGYVGFRYDYCKGFAPKYIKIYNDSSKPTLSVGEYWDGSYDVLANWIEGTGKTSAAFDFAFKYALNNAYSSGDLSKLVWYANGNPQPAGLIHYGYPQYAVTFIDNHDTYRDSNKFTGNVLAANAFMLCSPGTPCVFLPHWKAYKAQLKPIIAARNAAGVTNTSSVKVLRTSSSIYMAEITGTKGKVAVRIGGSSSDVPTGYDSSKLVASGNGYAVWSSLGTTGIPVDTGNQNDTEVVVYFRDTTSTWTQPYVYAWDAGNGNVTLCGDWPGTKMSSVEINGNTYWKYSFGKVSSTLMSPMVIFNNGSGGTGNQTADLTLVNNAVYNMSGVTSETIGGTSGGGGDTTGKDLYLVGAVNSWSVSDSYKFTYQGNDTYTFFISSLDGHFKIKDADANWKGVNLGGDAAGADVASVDAVVGDNTLWQDSSVNLNANNLTNVLLTLTYNSSSSSARLNIATNASGVNGITVDNDNAIEYYNLQGVRVTNPGHGIYIVRHGSTVSKVVIN
jgi:alpha-amylase